VTKLKVKITTKEDIKSENGRLKRELEVREKAIKQKEEEIELLKIEMISKKKYKNLQVEYEEVKNDARLLIQEKREYMEKYHKEHSLVIQLDCELENNRDQYRKVLSHNVNLTKENEHLRGLVGIYITR
jgi:hypothetical protein